MFQIERNLFMSSSQSMDPKELFLLQCNGLELKKPDLTIRYLAVKDIANGTIDNCESLRLYKKYASGNGFDPEFHVNKLIRLVNSFADHGYNPDYPLNFDKKMEITNGSHRLACALFFGVKTICFRYIFLKWDMTPTWDLMIKSGFSNEEIDFIRDESDLLVESIITNHEKEQVDTIDIDALRIWLVKEYKKVCRFDKRKLNGNSFVCVNKGGFYQSFPKLGITGARPTDIRIEQYGLKDLLNDSMNVLDIGCNIGFMDMEIAPLVRNVTGIEFNPVASRLSKSLARKLNIRNATFFDDDFKDWKNLSRRKYDLILSLEVHQWIGLSSKDYAAKIALFIKPCGFVLFEGHNLTENYNDYNEYIDAFVNNGFRCIKSEYIMDDSVTKRIWTLLQYNE